MYIYCIENKENEKKYIGLTTSDVKKRFYAHKTGLNCNNHANKFLQKDWNKYNNECFEFKILEECNSIKELQEREKALIQEYKSLFNQTGYNIHTGGSHHVTPKYVKDLNRKTNSIPIVQYSLKGNFIRTFDSITEASETMNTSLNNIVTSLKGVTKTAGGYQWRYLDSDFTYDIKPVKSSNYRRGSGWRKKIRQLDRDNNTVKIHNSIKEAGDSVDVTRQAIQQCLFGKSNTSAGFKWEYV